MSTIFIQPIFAPDEKRFERNKNSLESLISYISHYNCRDIKFAFGGWARDEYWAYFKNTIESEFGKNKICLIKFEQNYGKAVIVNSLYKKIKESNIDFNYILTADSDILFPLETPELFKRLEDVAEKSVIYRKMPFGLCGLQQLGNGCHYKTIYENKYDFQNILGENEPIVFPTQASGIAGGCLLISKAYWELFGGYRVYGVYGPDDATLLLGCSQYGYSWQVSDKISIIHPPENDEEYQKLKVRVCQRVARESVKNDISNEIKEMDAFWNSHIKNLKN